MYEKYLRKLGEPGQTVNPLFAWMGIEPVEIAEGRALLRMGFRESFVQGGGAVAGGVLAALLDEALAHAVITTLGHGEKCVTVELSVRYLNGAAPGRTLEAAARIVKRGRSVAFVEAEIADDQGKAVARADAVFAIANGRNGSGAEKA